MKNAEKLDEVCARTLARLTTLSDDREEQRRLLISFGGEVLSLGILEGVEAGKRAEAKQWAEDSLAVQKLFDCFDERLLIRDISKDDTPGHFTTTGMQIAAALAGCQRIIDRGNSPSKESEKP